MAPWNNLCTPISLQVRPIGRAMDCCEERCT